MNASRFVGRVGGLAFALGVGTVALGCATAWADSQDSPSPAATAHTAPHAGPQVHKQSSRALKPLLDQPTAPASALSDTDLPTSSTRSTGASALAAAPAAAETQEPQVPQVLQLPEASAAAEAQNIALIMGPSGVPIPPDDYLAAIYTLYVVPNSPAGTVVDGLYTPEGLYPLTGVKSLPLNTSVDQGVTILGDAIQQQLDAGNTLTVFGWSQSAILSSLEMANLPEDTPINFVLVGNEMNPNGGFLSRFPDLNMPSLGIPFYGATPPDSFPVVNYTLEYDGFGDFPRYPLNVLSVLNAGLGIVLVHTTYADLSIFQIGDAIALPTSDPSQQYYIIQHEDLPLLAPIRAIPVIGNPIADLLQPALSVIVNLGYGDPKYGWSTNGFANEQTTFGVLPDVNWLDVFDQFVAGIQQGVQDFIGDIMPGGPMWQDWTTFIAPVTHFVSSLAAATSPQEFGATIQATLDDIISDVQNLVTDVANYVSGHAAALYAALLPTADIINAIVTVLPAYAFTQFTNGIEQVLSGDIINGLINTILMPVAAISGLVTTAALIELLVIKQALEGPPATNS
jgi:hypothetical protein